MRKIFFPALALLICFATLSNQTAQAQQQQQQAASKTSTAGSTTSPPVDVNKIVRAFAAKETEFRRALNSYAFKREAVIQVIGMGGQIAGEYHRVSNFTFDDRGNRYEKIVYFPLPTFGGVTAEDLEDLSGVNPFALEASKLDMYNFTYVGKERIDELDLYVFDVAPKVTPKKSIERFFLGRIWVDDRDLQIVKSRGKGIPETKDNKFPVVETFREQIDGRYWFPTYSYADEQLVYDDGNVMHIRMRVKYTDFKEGRASVRIIDPEGNELEDAPKQPGNAPSTNPQAQVPVRGGILNGRAIEMPMPVYPAEARQAGIAGVVKVRVTVDEEGKVIAAEAFEGPKQLREAAVEAARKARFEPTRLHGAAIKIEGILTYNFAK